MKKLQISMIACLLVLALTASLMAQGYEFKVMASKGKSEVQKENSTNWADLKVGTQLGSKDKIKLTANTYLSLIHKSGKTIELKNAGTYSVAELSTGLSSNQANVSKRFSDYLMAELSSSEDLMSSKKGDKKTTGSVERSMNTQPFVDRNALQLNSPRKINLLSNVFTFRWNEFENAKEYEFTLTDRFDKPVFTKTVIGNSFTLNADEMKLDKDTYYFWRVKAKGNDKSKSDDACFLVLSNEKVKAIKDTVETIRKEVGDDNATSKMILAAYYEQNFLVEEALKSFKEAVAMAPEIDQYKNLYKRFLQKYHLSEK
jgi:hypothetical protein